MAEDYATAHEFDDLEEGLKDPGKRKTGGPQQQANGAAQQPGKIDPAAFHGPLGEITSLIEPQSESDPIGIMTHLMTFFGNAAGRAAHYKVEATWHTTNLFTLLVGVTSNSRKGTGADRAKEVFELVDPEWRANRIVDGLSSGEGLIWAVRDRVEQEVLDRKTKKTEVVCTDHGVADKRLCVLEAEFGGRVLQVLPRQGNTLSGVLRQAWESGRLMTLTKTNPARATGAHISIIGHITKDELLRRLDDTEIANGLINRFIFLSVKRARSLPFGGGNVDFSPLARELKASLEFARKAKQVTMDDDAREIWAAVYDHLTESTPGMFGAITARAAPQVIRMALIFALADRCWQIGEPHLSAALAIWRHSEASVLEIFGDTLGDPVADAILDALRTRAPNGMSRNDILTMFARNVPSGRIGAALGVLLAAAKVMRHTTHSGGRGRPTEMWFAA